MNYYTQILLLTILLFSSNVTSKEHSLSEKTMMLNSTYISDVVAEIIILKSLKERNWKIKKQSPGKVTAWLDNHRNHELVLEITYEKSEISFKQLSFKKLDCLKRNYCEAEPEYSEQWKTNLRRNIATKIHTLAMKALLENENVTNNWIDYFKTDNIKLKTTLARNMVETDFYDDRVMVEFSQQIKDNFQRKLSPNEVQQYAFFCKVLARSRQEKYRDLLTLVSKKANSLDLKDYAKGYLRWIDKQPQES